MLFSLNDFLKGISNALDYVEQDIFGVPTNHSKRIAYISLMIAKDLNFCVDESFDLVSLCILHDNGASLKILHDKLDGDFRDKLKCIESMQEHCVIGEENIQTFPFLTNPKDIIKYHHERYDGSGFFGLMGDEIPIMSQILSFSDTLDLQFLLTNAYIIPSLRWEINAYVQCQKKHWFSPKVTDAFLRVSSEGSFWQDLMDENIDQALVKHTPYKQMELSFNNIHNITKVFSKIIDAKSQFTQQHSQGLCKRVEIMALYYNLDQETTMKLLIAADLHDTGKLAISNSILDKPSHLSVEEFDLVKLHPEITRLCLNEIRGFEDITMWASNHHEKLDGSGYPKGLKEHELDFNSRLLACIDIYQALREDRPYRKAMSHHQSMAIMSNMANDGLIDKNIVNDIGKVLKT